MPSTQPTRGGVGRSRTQVGHHAPLLGFAPDEACRAVPVAGNAVGSYPTLSPLLRGASAYRNAAGRFAFCCAVCRLPGAAPGGAAPNKRPGVTRHHARRSPDFPQRIGLPIRRDGRTHRKIRCQRSEDESRIQSSNPISLFSSPSPSSPSSSYSSSSSPSRSSRSERLPASPSSKKSCSPCSASW